MIFPLVSKRFRLSFACIGSYFQLTSSFPSSSSPPPRRSDSSDYIRILASGAPLLDVRAPVEFAKGAFPASHNLPLLDDAQRERVGTCYSEQGQEAAIALGHALLEDGKAALVQRWKDHVARHPQGYLYCFRGGLRSHFAQTFLEEAGVDYPLITGGYKAMRSSLLLDLQESLDVLPIVLIGGRTCSGKTLALTRLSRFVDLEGLAQHRGSTFGGIARGDQPAQIDFENGIILEFCKHRRASATLPVFVEDEGERIGARSLPVPMHRPMAEDFPLVILDTPLSDRVDLCIAEYVQDPLLAFLGDATPGASRSSREQEAHALIRYKFMGGLDRIRKGLQKRMGNKPKVDEMFADFEEAFALFESSAVSDVSGFRRPIQTLLEDYYDGMYDYQQGKRQGEVLFRGNREEVVKWAEAYGREATT